MSQHSITCCFEKEKKNKNQEKEKEKDTRHGIGATRIALPLYYLQGELLFTGQYYLQGKLLFTDTNCSAPVNERERGREREADRERE